MTMQRPETLARALLRLLEDNPKDIRARTPIPFVFVDHDQMEENRRKYLAQRAVVEGIAALRIDGLTRASRLLEVDAMRKFATVPVADLAAAYDDMAAQEDARLAELEAAIAKTREDLGPSWKPHAPVLRAPLNIAEPKRARVVDYNDTRLREIIEDLEPCRTRSDALTYDYLLGDLGDDHAAHCIGGLFECDGGNDAQTGEVDAA